MVVKVGQPIVPQHPRQRGAGVRLDLEVGHVGLRTLGPIDLLDTADHGFKTLKRSRKSDKDVFVEMGRIVGQWASCMK
jgi:hypothetical protein